MAIEIERRFLAHRRVLEFCTFGQRIVQGYISAGGAVKMRIRVVGSKGFLTIKSKRVGCARIEIEQEISAETAWSMLTRVDPDTLIKKVRYKVLHAGLTWEVDVFEGRNAGLMIAEVELSHSDQPVELPDWVGREVTAEERYGNSTLAVRPAGSRDPTGKSPKLGEQPEGHVGAKAQRF
jgi:CYTH domain-containing protein